MVVVARYFGDMIRLLKILNESASAVSAGSLFQEQMSHLLSVRLTGQLADKPTCGQSSRGLDNLRTGQLADSEFGTSAV